MKQIGIAWALAVLLSSAGGTDLKLELHAFEIVTLHLVH